MQGDFLIKVRAVYNQFTKAEKKVADYILQHPKDVLFMSITDLAEACDVGDTSVFRFCKTMKDVYKRQPFTRYSREGLPSSDGNGTAIWV